MLGGYDYYAQWKDNLGDSYADDAYLLGTADFDYADMASNVTFESGDSEKQSLTVTRRKKSTVVEGGC